MILTYCCRNVSVGRVIGIHIGRVMGGREHSVVVDSESWTNRQRREIVIDTQTQNRRHKRTVRDRQLEPVGGMWGTGIR